MPGLHLAMAILFLDTVVGLVQNGMNVRQCGGTSWINMIAMCAVPEL